MVWGPSLTPSPKAPHPLPPPNSVSLPPQSSPSAPLTHRPSTLPVPVSPGRQLSIMCFSQNPSGTHCARRSPAEASACEAAESRRWRERCQSLSLIINFCHSAPVATTRSGSLPLPPPPAQSLSPHCLFSAPLPPTRTQSLSPALCHSHSVPLPPLLASPSGKLIWYATPATAKFNLSLCGAHTHTTLSPPGSVPLTHCSAF